MAGIVAGATTTFVASLSISLEINAPVVALATSATGAIVLYGKNKINKE